MLRPYATPCALSHCVVVRFSSAVSTPKLCRPTGCHWRLVPILSGKFSWLRPRIGALPFGVREPRSRFCHAQPCCAWYRSAAWLQTNKAPAWLAHSTIAPPAHNGANLFRTVLGSSASARHGARAGQLPAAPKLESNAQNQNRHGNRVRSAHRWNGA